MTEKIDFQRYSYYYNGWIARKNKKTGTTEMFVKGQWKETNPSNDIELMTKIGANEAVKIEEKSVDFLQEQLRKKYEEKRTL